MICNKSIFNICGFLFLTLYSFGTNAKIKDTSCLASKYYLAEYNSTGSVTMEKAYSLNFAFKNGDLYISETRRGSQPYKYGTSKYTGYGTYLVNSNMLVNINSSDIPTKAAIVDANNINVYWLYCR
ncbi:hypothetical protein [Vibrio cholerae]|uniref:hypothetical protein n=1 Tax=Vibrio cholerae TaxID=666 RepID=UPI001F075C11|nr:hypothetical protein [Vibrio cholerae]